MEEKSTTGQKTNWEDLGISNDFLFGKGRHLYTFENICREDNGITLGDGTTKLFLMQKVK